MSYIPYPSKGGVGGMYEYENATVMGIDQVSTYHLHYPERDINVVHRCCHLYRNRYRNVGSRILSHCRNGSGG